jgi:3-oxoacyl-[acyl-carrier protein] reductase
MKLENRIALVTGAGSGLGRALAVMFASEGAFVYVNDVSLEAATRTVQGMSPMQGKGFPIRADVSDSAQVLAMFAEVDRRHERLDILVNNAGALDLDSSKTAEINRKFEAQVQERMTEGRIRTHWDITQAMTDEEWHRMIGVHLNGTFFCTREALKLMGRRNRGVIINMSSMAAQRGVAAGPHYGAAKAGIVGFTRSVALEVASRNIRVNAICPGFIETPMVQVYGPRMKSASIAQVPMARWGNAREVATTALFLASDDSSYFTGQCLSPNGGLFIG